MILAIGLSWLRGASTRPAPIAAVQLSIYGSGPSDLPVVTTVHTGMSGTVPSLAIGSWNVWGEHPLTHTRTHTHNTNPPSLYRIGAHVTPLEP